VCLLKNNPRTSHQPERRHKTTEKLFGFSHQDLRSWEDKFILKKVILCLNFIEKPG
jgi:hypothetical protein